MYGAEAGGGQFGADWNGGHTFSQSAVDFSLQEYIEPEVAQKNPQLSPAEIRVEATRILALRLVQDQSFDQKEALREEDMVTKWEVADVDGKKQLVTRYGDRNVSLEELWRHTEEFALRVGKPGAFNRAEMQTQLAIQDALIAGRATDVIFTLSHPESVRYVQQWQRREDGAFYSTQIDIGKHAGRDLRHDEVKSFLDRFRDQYHDTAIEVEGAVTGSYVAVRGSMDTVAIPMAAKLQTMTSGSELFARRLPSSEHASRSSPNTSDRAFPLWVIADRRWFSEYTRKEKKDMPQRTESIYKQEKLSLTPKTHVQQEGSSDGKLLRKEYETRRIATCSLQIATETGVAVHAAPVLLAALAEKLPIPIRAVEKSMRRHRKKELRIKNKELRKKKRKATTQVVEVRGLNREGVKSVGERRERKGRKKRRKVYMGETAATRIYTFGERDRRKKIGVKKVAAAELLTPIAMSKPDKQERREKKRLRRAVEKSVGRHKKKELRVKNKELRRIEKREARKESVKVQPLKTERVEPFTERKQSIQRKEREAIVGIRFAWMVWMILTRKDSETPKNNFKRSHPALQGETLRRQEVTLWILLSIIYYLTAIREQGIQHYPMKKKRRTLPKKGIIFAFRS